MQEFLKDEKIKLIRFSEKFITAEYVSWLNDHSVTQYLCTGRLPVSEDDVKILKDSRTNVRFAIVYTEKGSFEYVGTISLNNIDWVSRKGDIGYMLGKSSFWGRGIASRAIGLVSDYAFNRLGLNKVTAGVVEGNIGSAKALEKNGFKQYGTNPQDYYLNGELLGTHLFYKLRAGE